MGQRADAAFRRIEIGERSLVVASEAMERVVATVRRVAAFDIPVLLIGDSGTGKELLARLVHRSSRRRHERFVAVNCGALPETLLEAELFGHVRGAFTGAERDRPGLLEEANGGTLFLDEVGELPARGQALLLRALQEKEARRLGANRARRVDFRLVAATNRPLSDEVAAGRFRADLFFRLRVVAVEVPPLSARPEDVLALARHALGAHAARLGLPTPRIDDEAAEALVAYPWPGNVRELENEMLRALLRTEGKGRLEKRHLSDEIARREGQEALRSAACEFERRYLAEALARHGGNRARTARALGLSRQGLYGKMRRLGLVARP